MKTMIYQGVVLCGLLTVLTGLAYPLTVTGVAKALFPRQAEGSLVWRHGKPAGSELLAQAFTEARYFHPRPSAAGFASVPAGASNLGPTSGALRDAVAARAAALRRENGLPPETPLPPDLLTASGSGLDPHLSPAAAELQINRVATARHFNLEQRARLERLVRESIEPPQFGLLGNARVNVLKLNLEVDRL